MQIRVFGYMVLLPSLQNQGLQQLLAISLVEASWLILMIYNLIRNFKKIMKLVLLLDILQSLSLLSFLLSIAAHIVCNGNTELADTHQQVLIYSISCGILAEFIAVGVSFILAILRYMRLKVQGKQTRNRLDVYYRTTRETKMGAVAHATNVIDDPIKDERDNLDLSFSTVNTVKKEHNYGINISKDEQMEGSSLKRGTMKLRGRAAFRNTKLSTSSTRKNSVKSKTAHKKRSIFHEKIQSSQISPLFIPLPTNEVTRNGRKMGRMNMTGILATP